MSPMLINFQFLATSVPELVQVLPIELLTMLLKFNPVLCRVEYRSASNCLPGKLHSLARLIEFHSQMLSVSTF